MGGNALALVGFDGLNPQFIAALGVIFGQTLCNRRKGYEIVSFDLK
jgi:hypothetical protein